MATYEPDPETAALFARHKTARKAVADTRKPVMAAAEQAMRAGASNQQLAHLTGLTAETFRSLADKLGIDNRQKAPTVGREVEAAKTSQHAPAAEEFPTPPASIRKLTGTEAAHLAQVATDRAPERAAHYDRIAHTSKYGYYSVVDTALKTGDLRKADLDS